MPPGNIGAVVGAHRAKSRRLKKASESAARRSRNSTEVTLDVNEIGVSVDYREEPPPADELGQRVAQRSTPPSGGCCILM